MAVKRLFLAIPLTEEQKVLLEEYLEVYKRHPFLKKVRFVPKENLHITALFLGNIQEKDVRKIDDALHVVSQIKEFHLNLKAATLKKRRMIWLEYEEHPSFTSLVEMLKKELQEYVENGVFDTQKPKAHITCARFSQFLKEDITFPTPPSPLHNITVDHIELFESTLVHIAPIYTKRGSYPLCKNTPS